MFEFETLARDKYSAIAGMAAQCCTMRCFAVECVAPLFNAFFLTHPRVTIETIRCRKADLLCYIFVADCMSNYNYNHCDEVHGHSRSRCFVAILSFGFYSV